MLVPIKCPSCGHVGLMSAKPPFPRPATCSKCGSRMLARPEKPPPAMAAEDAAAEA
jgi:DNA-directed RNA polymerase subunit RPC12/RpoP